MPKQTWIIAAVLSALVLLAIVYVSIRKQSIELARVQATLAEAQSALEKKSAEIADLQSDLEESEDLVDSLREANESATKTQHSLEDEMRKALESKDVTISELKGKLTVNILDRILFDSGEAELKPEGQRILEKIAGVLAQHTNRQIYVIGHTDNVPIRTRFPSNWELSAARATAAIRFLQEKGGVDPKLLAAVGYGEHHPIADNATAEGRSRNRRIAL